MFLISAVFGGAKLLSSAADTLSRKLLWAVEAKKGTILCDLPMQLLPHEIRAIEAWDTSGDEQYLSLVATPADTNRLWTARKGTRQVEAKFRGYRDAAIKEMQGMTPAQRMAWIADGLCRAHGGVTIQPITLKRVVS